MSAVTLTKDAVSVSLPHPVAEYAVERPPRQRVGISGGGAVKVAVLGLSDTVHNMTFAKVPPAQGTALLAFIDNTILNSAYTFSLTDWNGTTTTNVRYITGRDTWKQGRGGLWAGRLSMRKDFGA